MQGVSLGVHLGVHFIVRSFLWEIQHMIISADFQIQIFMLIRLLELNGWFQEKKPNFQFELKCSQSFKMFRSGRSWPVDIIKQTELASNSTVQLSSVTGIRALVV